MSPRLSAVIMRNWWFIAAVALVSVALAGVMVTSRGSASGPDASARTVSVGAPAPTIELANVAGERVRFPSPEAPSILLVNFWATWCAPCREEMPALQRLADEYQGRPIQMVEVDLQENAGAVQDFEQQLNLRLLVLLDQDGAAARAYGVRALPATFLLDRSGVLREKRLGALLTDGGSTTPWTTAWVRTQIDDLLQT